AVSFHSLPLVGYISTPSSENDLTGLSQSRSTIMNHIASMFAAAPEASQWNKLFLRDGSSILRVISPGQGTSTSAAMFDANYLDDAATYGYSYIADIWSDDPNSFYRNNELKLTIPNGSLETYTGVINGDNTITFTSSPSGYEVVFA